MFTVLAPNSLEQHSLLDPPSIEYSAGTVQRACLVWTRLGQQNRFTDVCGYFHRLEALEETIPSEQQAFSRGLEYSLLSSPPPTSSYLQANYPSLYPDLASLTQQHEHEEMKRLNELKLMLAATMARNEKMNGYRQVKNGYYAANQSNLRSGTTLVQDLASGVVDSQEITGPVNGAAFINQVTTHNFGYTQGKTQNMDQGTLGLATPNGEDIVAASKIIRSYCMTHQTTLRQFLSEFKEYATIHGVNPTVSNVAFYIKHKTVLNERELEANVTENGLRKLFIPSPVNSIKGKTKSDEETFRGKITHKKPEVSNNVDVKNTREHRSRFAKECQTSKIEPVSDIDEILEQISQMRTVFNDEVNGLKSDLERKSNNTLPNVTSKNSSDGDTANANGSKSQDSSVNIVTIPIIEKDGNAVENDKQTEKSKKRSVFGLKIVNLRGKSRKGAKHDSSRRSSLKDKISKIKSVTSISNESSESFNLIDFDSSFENCNNFSEDFDTIPNNRCSMSSR